LRAGTAFGIWSQALGKYLYQLLGPPSFQEQIPAQNPHPLDRKPSRKRIHYNLAVIKMLKRGLQSAMKDLDYPGKNIERSEDSSREKRQYTARNNMHH
jgi:hypothetical protein